MSEAFRLKWDVFVTPGIPAVTSDLPPGATQRFWPPMSSTLISGKRDAVLVDAFLTVEQAGAFVDWVTASVENCTCAEEMVGAFADWTRRIADLASGLLDDPGTIVVFSRLVSGDHRARI